MEIYTHPQNLSTEDFRKDSTLLFEARQQKIPGRKIKAYPKN
jgi:hypothetical protein